MKKISIALLAFVTALTVASCQKETPKEAETTPEVKGMTISAVSEGICTGVKAELAYKYDILWNQDDQIRVKNTEKSVDFTLVNGEGTTKGIFSSDESISGEVEAFYPADVANLVWPAEQQNNQLPPMYCKKTLASTLNQTFNFTSLGSMLQLAFNSTTPNIVVKNVKVSADEPMSGAFTITDGKAVISQPESGKPGITLNLEEGVAMGTSSKYFNIAIPSGTYTALTIVLTTTDGRACTIQAKNALSIGHNTVNKLTISGEFHLPGTTGKAKANIGGVEKDVPWIQLWENGPKFAKYNVGVTDGKAESYGGYYCWGSSIDKDSDLKYNQSNVELTGADDTATNLWGEKWRMPTSTELEDLTNPNYCRCSYIFDYNGTGVNGLLCKGIGIYSSNSIFFPAAGMFTEKLRNLNDVCCYWSTTPVNDGDHAYYMGAGQSGNHVVVSNPRERGFSIRAVFAE